MHVDWQFRILSLLFIEACRKDWKLTPSLSGIQEAAWQNVLRNGSHCHHFMVAAFALRQTLGAEAQVATVQRDPTGESVLSIGAQAEASQRDAAASAASAAPAPADASRQEEAARESQEADGPTGIGSIDLGLEPTWKGMAQPSCL